MPIYTNTKLAIASYTLATIPYPTFPYECRAISSKIYFDPIFYFSSDLETKDPFGPLIVQNTKNCDGF